MIVRKVDSSGDWSFGSGVGSYAQANDAIKQNIKTKILSWKDDCFFAVQDGMDWTNLLAPGGKGKIDLALKNLVLSAFGVVSLNSLSSVLDPRTRKLIVTINVDTIYSTGFQFQIDDAAGVSNAG